MEEIVEEASGKDDSDIAVDPGHDDDKSTAEGGGVDNSTVTVEGGGDDNSTAEGHDREDSSIKPKLDIVLKEYVTSIPGDFVSIEETLPDTNLEIEILVLNFINELTGYLPVL